MNIESSGIYSDLTSKGFIDEKILNIYKRAQTYRHQLKSDKLRGDFYYESVSEQIIPIIDSKSESMLCLGTRNNHERECFKKILQLENIYSCDISAESEADYILDFNFLPSEWLAKWDIVFSNCLDHALNPTFAIFSWLDIIKPGGHLVLGIDTSEIELSLSDCNKFTRKSVCSFLKSLQDDNKIHYSSEFLPSAEIDWPHYLIRKT